MADKLYLDVLKSLAEEPGGDLSSYGLPPAEAEPVPPDYFAGMKAFSSFMQQGQPQQPLPQFQLPKPAEKVGLLQRPQQALSELVLGGDPLKALTTGRASTPSLGYAMFPEAQTKGFQPADVPAFAVDVATDPLTYILPAVLGKSVKLIGKLFGTQVPVKFFAQFAGDVLQKAPAAQKAALRGMWRPVETGGLGMTDEWMREIMLGGKLIKPGQLVPKIKDLAPDQVTDLLSHMQNIQTMNWEPATGFFGDVAKYLGRNLGPVASVLERQGGVYGARVAKGVNNLMRGTQMNFGRVMNEYLGFLDNNKLDNVGATAIRKASTLIAEAGGVNAPMSEIMRVVGAHGNVPQEVLDVFAKPKLFDQAKNLGQRSRELFDNYQGILSGFKDAGGREFMVQMDKGAVPFREAVVKNYMPHTFDWAKLKFGSIGYHDFVTNFMKANQLTSRSVAQDVIETMVKKVPKKFANIEHGRLFNMGDYELDPLAFLPNWLHKTEYRLNFAKEFGLGGNMKRVNSLSQLMRGAKESGLNSKWADEVEQMLLGRSPKDFTTTDIVNKITGFQVINKMGLGSTLMNLSQNANTATVFGLGNFVKGALASFTDEGEKLGALAYNRATKDAIHEMMTGNPGHGLASRYLDAAGFNWAEKWNRFFGANTGVAALKDWSAQLAKGGSPQIAEKLQRLLGVTDQELVHLASRGQISRDMLDRAALQASEVTQHATQWHQVPLMWQNPHARIMLQYKNFAYNQTRFMFQHVMGPALEYVNSKGASGDLMPLMRAAPLFVGAGHGLSHLRDLMRSTAGAALTGDWKKQEKWLWEMDDDWMMAALKDAMTVGSVGMIGDMFTAAQRGKLPNWLLGPTVGDLMDLGQRGVQLGTKAHKKGLSSKDLDTFATWIGRRAGPPALAQVPGVGLGLAALAQQYPYDVTYGDIDLDELPRKIRQALEGQ